MSGLGILYNHLYMHAVYGDNMYTYLACSIADYPCMLQQLKALAMVYWSCKDL